MPLAFKQVGLLTLQGALWEPCMQANSHKRRDVQVAGWLFQSWRAYLTWVVASYIAASTATVETINDFLIDATSSVN